ncbi:MerR family transcriptional regulator [Paenibacillus flagellatus]|uniref:MerR family transcriptional regulator n=1 Tax=Paenibacillus flagellatus TaxID=2211139 RepID=A0A2V5K1R8_9BACL|nr:MerR family transcriptional regulator [Paenibacillus flagellatus]PYI53129.1 MerR family transcriptional regulator [Paenibacillus flagellatus]
MPYTVKDMSALSGVTVKTLHHYDEIGLLPPSAVSEAGYRLYGRAELERLQLILFYRELDFPLKEIARLLEEETDRYAMLSRQKELLLARKRRLETVIRTLQQSMSSMEKGETMNDNDMFKGFENASAWEQALEEQQRHLKDTYGFDMPAPEEADVQAMNEQAREAAAFMNGMADALRTGVKHGDAAVRRLIGDHLDALNRFGHAVTAEQFAAQTRFFLEDDFHLRMLEGQQTGLAYYLSAAADSYAAKDGGRP